MTRSRDCDRGENCSGRRDETVDCNLPQCSLCPSGWKEFKGECYQFVEYTLTWSAAEQHCRRMKANWQTDMLTCTMFISIRDTSPLFTLGRRTPS